MDNSNKEEYFIGLFRSFDLVIEDDENFVYRDKKANCQLEVEDKWTKVYKREIRVLCIKINNHLSK